MPPTSQKSLHELPVLSQTEQQILESFADWTDFHEPAPRKLKAIAHDAQRLAKRIAKTEVMQVMVMTGRLTAEDYVEICSALERLAWAAGHDLPARTRGRRKLPSWLNEAAKFLFAIWRKKAGLPAKPYFIEAGTTQPANDFTRWFCRTMRKTHPKVTITQCSTVMKRTYRARITPVE